MSGRLNVLLGLCVLMVVAALFVLAYTLFRAPYEAGRARWLALGQSDYRLLVTRYCACGPSGLYRITVHAGHVTRYESLSSDEGPFGPTLTINTTLADFDSMTIEAMLRRAAQAQPNLWPLPWQMQAVIQYDPINGYVTSYVVSPIGINGHAASSDSYRYFARDLEPAP